MTKQEILEAYFQPRYSGYFQDKEHTAEYMREFFQTVNGSDEVLTLKELLAPPLKISDLHTKNIASNVLYDDMDNRYDEEFTKEIDDFPDRVWNGEPEAKWKIIGFRVYGHEELFNLSVVCVRNSASVLCDPDFGTSEWSERNRCIFPLYLTGTNNWFLFEFSERRAYVVETVQHLEHMLIQITEIIDGKKTRTIVNHNEWDATRPDDGDKEKGNWEIIPYR